MNEPTIHGAGFDTRYLLGTRSGEGALLYGTHMPLIKAPYPDAAIRLFPLLCHPFPVR